MMSIGRKQKYCLMSDKTYISDPSVWVPTNENYLINSSVRNYGCQFQTHRSFIMTMGSKKKQDEIL